MEAGVQHSTALSRILSETGRVFSINTVGLIAENFPLRQKRLVEDWAELHQEELQKDWDRLQSGKLPEPIEPLR